VVLRGMKLINPFVGFELPFRQMIKAGWGDGSGATEINRIYGNGSGRMEVSGIRVVSPRSGRDRFR
jgi:hypothetical protein